MFYTINTIEEALCFSYSPLMTHPRTARSRNTLSFRLGTWFEAHATGWGVWAVPFMLLLLGAVALARALVGLG